jgi:hypothetical protein
MYGDATEGRFFGHEKTKRKQAREHGMGLAHQSLEEYRRPRQSAPSSSSSHLGRLQTWPAVVQPEIIV